MNDDEVIKRIKQGDERALDFLYKKHYKMMVNMVVKNSGTIEEAKDIYQDALIIFWQKVRNESFILSSKISTFIFGICQKRWFKELERKNKFVLESKEQVEEVDIHQEERISLIIECINGLDDKCRKILTYYYFDRMTMIDIAEKMGLPNADSAKTQKYRCKKELDKIIKSKYSTQDFLD